MTESLINVNGENVQALEILFLTTMITLLPSLLVMMTSFTRYIISFSFLRSAIGTQQTPPNMVLVGMAEAVKLPLRVVVPSFMTCELQRAFEIGLLLYIPFMLIDIVVSSTLMSMGMIMLPPSMISMPFKLLLFVTVNGWQLLFSSLVQSFK